MTKKENEPAPKRAIVYIDRGVAWLAADRGVEVEIIDWDNMRDGDVWTPAEIASFEKWGAGLVPPRVIADLQKYATRAQEAADGK